MQALNKSKNGICPSTKSRNNNKKKSAKKNEEKFKNFYHELESYCALEGIGCAIY